MPWEWYVLGCYPVKNVPFGVLAEQQLDFGFSLVKFPDDILELPLRNTKSRFDIEWYENLRFIQWSGHHLFGCFRTEGSRVDDCDDSGVFKGKELRGMVEADRLGELGRELPSFCHPGADFGVIGFEYLPFRFNQRSLFVFDESLCLFVFSRHIGVQHQLADIVQQSAHEADLGVAHHATICNGAGRIRSHQGVTPEILSFPWTSPEPF